jgi:hypothetical protein
MSRGTLPVASERVPAGDALQSWLEIFRRGLRNPPQHRLALGTEICAEQSEQLHHRLVRDLA